MSHDVLAQHIDNLKGQRHRCVLLDNRRLHCHDCRRTLILPAQPGSSTATKSPLQLHHPDACTRHPGQRHGACGPCRAEHLEADRVLDQQPTADVTAGAAAARQVLTDLARHRRTRPDLTGTPT